MSTVLVLISVVVLALVVRQDEYASWEVFFSNEVMLERCWLTFWT